MVEHRTNQDVVHEFLHEMWGGAPSDHYFLIWTMPDKRSRWFRCTEDGIDSAADTVASLDARDVYMGAGLSAQSYGSRQRVSASEVVGIAGLWADIDIASAVHKKPNLPPDEPAALELLQSACPPATGIIHSGNGLQAWWLFEKHWSFTSDTDRAAAAALSAKWNDHLRTVARESGWDVDATHDLARVMRVPGTLNQKQSPAKPVSMREWSGRRHVAEGMRKLVRAPDVSTVSVAQQAAQISVEFELRSDAAPPTRKWDALKRVDRNVEATFEHKRRDIGDQSPSGYDMALANYAALAQWDDQEIVDLLVYHRAEHGNDLKLHRPDYYSRTVRKARDMAARANAAENIDMALSELEGTVDEAERDEQRLKLLDWLSPLLRTGVTRIERYGTEPSHYRMLTESGWVNLGTSEQLLNQNIVRARMVEITRSVFARMKAGEWDRVAEAIVRASIDVDMGPEPTLIGSMRSWLEDYMDQHPPAPELDETVALSRTPFITQVGEEDIVCLFPSHFRIWLERSDNEKLSLREVTMRMRMTGCSPKKVNITVKGNPTSRSVWRLPKEFLT